MTDRPLTEVIGMPGPGRARLADDGTGLILYLRCQGCPSWLMAFHQPGESETEIFARCVDEKGWSIEPARCPRCVIGTTRQSAPCWQRGNVTGAGD